MNILFLDVDGPLIPTRMTKEKEPEMPQMLREINRRSSTEKFVYWKMDSTIVSFLNSLKEYYEFQVVLSSSWRKYLTKQECIHWFTCNQLKLYLYLHNDWCTPDINLPRDMQIKMWLDNHSRECKDFIVLDDEKSGVDILNSRYFKKHRIIVNEFTGPSFDDLEKLYLRMSSWV